MSKYNVKVGIIGGSGLDNPDLLLNASEELVTTPFGSPSDKLISGYINGIHCVLISRHGRHHTITPSNVNYRANLWALKEAGCTHILASSACGSLQENIVPGQIVIPDSFIDLTKKRNTTFYDNNKQFPDLVMHLQMEPAFCQKTRNILIEEAKKLNISCHPAGTVVVIEGPRFSSFAESNVYRSWGAHLINMTVVPELILAKELGLCYAVVAMATDYDCWHTGEACVSAANVVQMFEQNAQKVTDIFINAVQEIAQTNWDDTIDELKVVLENSVQSH